MSKAPKRRPPQLTSDQIRYLRGLGHHLSPLAMVGKDGIDDNLIKTVQDNLTAHELIKVKVQHGSPLDRKEAAAALAVATASALVQVLGNTFLLYRPNPDRKGEAAIALPAAKKKG